MSRYGICRAASRSPTSRAKSKTGYRPLYDIRTWKPAPGVFSAGSTFWWKDRPTEPFTVPRRFVKKPVAPRAAVWKK